MKKKKILCISQETTPYFAESTITNTARINAQALQEKGAEVRNFMPKYGSINERRHQLHEVLRLSGMNIVINDNDQPLIIKVASIPPTRMQMYFIDNDDFFNRKTITTNEDGSMFEDNDERMLFFARGVLETTKKLGWTPDLIVCSGWLSAMMPLLIKTMYKDEPVLNQAKIVYLLNDEPFEGSLDKNCSKKIEMQGINKKFITLLKDPTYVNVSKLAIQYADAVVIKNTNVDSDIISYIHSENKPVVSVEDATEEVGGILEAFYKELLMPSLVV